MADSNTAKTDAPRTSSMRFMETGSAPLLKRHLLNVVLMVLTLGLYRFWAVTNMRRMIWRRIRLDDHPFEYTGTGLEIFIGFLRVLLIILLPIALAFLVLQHALERDLPTVGMPAFGLVDVLYVVVLLMLIEMGRFLSWRYRLSRTRWRGIRGRIELPAAKYLAIAAASAAAVVLSGSLLKPIVDLAKARAVVNSLNVGGLKGAYDGGLTGLMASWIGTAMASGIVVLVLGFVGSTISTFILSIGGTGLASIVLLCVGLLTFWIITFIYSVYRVALWQHVCAHASVGPAKLRFTGAPAELASITFWNWVTLVLSLGLLAPLTWERKLRYVTRHLSVTDLPDAATLRQVDEDVSAAAGEGLAGDFDVA